MATWIFPETVLEGSLQCVGAEEEAVWGHRAGMEADLAPAEAKTKRDKGSGGTGDGQVRS